MLKKSGMSSTSTEPGAPPFPLTPTTLYLRAAGG
jgi:hypothetical protein